MASETNKVTLAEDFNSPMNIGALSLGAIMGAATGIRVDRHLQNLPAVYQAQNEIFNLKSQQGVLRFEKKHANTSNQGLEDYLQQRIAANSKQIKSLQPAAQSVNTVEHIGVPLGGAMVGMLAVSACFIAAKRTLLSRKVDKFIESAHVDSAR